MNLQQKAEASLQKAVQLLLEHLPREEIVAIYAKGSYVLGEMNEDSDVDLVVVLKTENNFLAIGELSKKYGQSVEPPFSLGMYTLDELRTGKVSALRTKGMTPVSRFVKSIDALKLLFGSKPEGELFSRSYARDLFNNVNTFKNQFLPKYTDSTFTFPELLKQVFWLGEAEARYRGIKTEYSWQSIADSFSDPVHVVKEALRLRRQGRYTDVEKETFIKRLEAYLAELEHLLADATS